jgi:hypothetical protein
MWMLRRFLAAKPIRNALVTSAAFFFLAGRPAGAADITAPPEVEPTSYTYVNLEGGYIDLDGEPVQAYLQGSTPVFDESNFLRERSLNISEGYYGRAELGHGWSTGLINGIGVYVQGWEGNKEDVSDTDFAIGLPYKGKSGFVTNVSGSDCASGDPCPFGEGKLDRSLTEVGIRFFHDYGEAMSLDHLTLGIEPFVAFIDEDSKSKIGLALDGLSFITDDRSSKLDADAYGALLALDLNHSILERTALIARIAGGPYYVNADAHTDMLFDQSLQFSDEISSNSWGFRGQLALGLEQMLSDSFSIGVIGRLDYWSDYPTMDWPEFSNLRGDGAKSNSIASDDLLTLSIGARVSLNFR